MQKQASPRVSHLGKARRGAITDFIQGGQMRVAAELKDEHDEHEEGHEEVQAVKFGDTGKHERDYRNLAFRIAELACKKETCEHVENAGCKGGRIHDGHNPLEIRHVIEGRRGAQMKHHDVNACEESKAIESRKVIRFCYSFQGFRNPLIFPVSVRNSTMNMVMVDFASSRDQESTSYHSSCASMRRIAFFWKSANSYLAYPG